MKCIRCGEVINTDIPELNAENYGSNIWACPNCGKAYQFYRTVVCRAIDTDAKENDWGKKIIKNSRKYDKSNKDC